MFPCMKKVRVTHPVVGVIVTAMIGMGCLAAARPATARAASGRRDVIRPGDGAGPVVLGMSEEEMERAMGKPAQPPAGIKGSRYEWAYPDKGMAVPFTKAEPRKAGVILAGHAFGVQPVVSEGEFPWRTEEGLGMGSTADEVQRAYGPPEADEQPHAQPHWRLLSYTSRGIQFGLSDGRVVWIVVRAGVRA
jgi:hypothetical protein